MHRVEPKIFCVGMTQPHNPGVEQYLTHIGVPAWKPTVPTSGPEYMIELMGRGCYMSYEPGLNPNITRIRPTPEHLENIVESGHGSVLEHSFINFMFCDVSRVFTHELVRHRAGTAISQESLRYVRLKDLGLWIPQIFSDDEESVSILEEAYEYLETAYTALLKRAAAIQGKDFNKISFDIKKKYTSAARRVAPIGLATNMGWSANFRALRHIIEDRTAPWAEEEIRVVFGMVGRYLMDTYPLIFGDYTIEVADNLDWFKARTVKV